MDEDLGARQDHRAEPLFDPYHKWLGIPPQEQPPNHYRLLGISLCETDSQVIDAAAQRQMAYLQACATGTRALLAQRLVDDIAAARLCLLDRARKATYDAALKRRRDTAPQATQGSLTGEWLVEPQSVDVPSLEPPISTKPAGFGYGLRFALIGAVVTAAAVGVVSLLVLSSSRQNNAVSPAPDVTDRTRIVVPPAAPSQALPIGPPSEPVVTQAEPPFEHEEIRPEPPPKEPVHAPNAATGKYHPSELGERVDRAIRLGVGYIKRQQRADGTWDDPEMETRSAGSSLAALALLAAGEKPNSPAIVKPLEFLRNYGPEEVRSTYAIALQTMVFAAAEPKKDRSRIAANVAWLERAQIKKGDKVLWPGSWTYSDQKLTRPGDASCSYFALLGLHAASEAGVPVKSEIWTAARTFWKNGQKRDGAWAYMPDSGVSAASVTCAGISCSLMANQWIGPPGGRELLKNDVMRACGVAGTDTSPRKGLEWLADHFSVKENIGHGTQWQYYYLWGLEQAARLAGVRLLGEHDWYRLGAEELVTNQNKLSGSWQGVLAENHRLVATCFAVIFLSNGRLPVLINKLRHAPGNDWDNDSHDVNNLVSIISRDWEIGLCWQILDLDQANASDFSPAPIVFFNGHKRPEFSAAAKQKLREYVEHGGFVFAEACCGSAEFDDGFRKLMKEVFPEPGYELRPLADDDPIWTAKYNIMPGSHPISGIRYGARTSIIYSSKDLSCYWNQARNAPRNPAVIKAIQLGHNVVDYATSRALPPDKLSVR